MNTAISYVQSALIGFSVGVLIAIWLGLVYSLSNAENKKRIAAGVKAFGNASNIVLVLILWLLICFFGTFYWMVKMTQIGGSALRKEAIFMSVNAFLPLSIFTSALGFFRLEQRYRELATLILTTFVALGTFSGTMMLFYIDSKQIDILRAHFFIFAFGFSFITYLIFFFYTVYQSLKASWIERRAA